MSEKYITPADVDQLWRDFKATLTDQELRNQLVEIYLPLVKYNCERVWARLPEGVKIDDLVSAAVLGLIDAINAFDLSSGIKFEIFCVPHIRNAMLRALLSMDGGTCSVFSR
jgi:RNA polymerase sigma factor for flagellar operon FliA